MAPQVSQELQSISQLWRVRSSWSRALASLSGAAVTAAVTGTAVRTHLDLAQLHSCLLYRVVTFSGPAEDGQASAQAGGQTKEYQDYESE